MTTGGIGGIELRPVADDAMLERVVAAAVAGADPDDVTPPLGAGWAEDRLRWLRTYHRERLSGLDGAAGEATWAVVLPGDDDPVGVVRLRRLDDDRFETGIWVVRNVRGRGAGRASFAALVEQARAHGGRQVVADTTSDNAAALALLRAAGFDLAADGDTGAVRATLPLR